MHAILCINRTKKSFHVTVYKLARIWSIKPVTMMNTPVTATVETTRSTIINYATENAVLLCYMNIAKNLSLLSVVWQHFITLTGACDF